MDGCTNCAAKSGCNDRKGTMFGELADALDKLYPTRTWGEPDDLTRFEAGVDEWDGQAIADELAGTLDASTFFRPGTDEEYCDYIYVLCIGREPCLVQIRDAGVPVPEEMTGDMAGQPIREQYLRVCLSHMARMAGIQQTAMEMDFVGGEYVIRELPRAGVYDAPLLPRMQRLVAVLPPYDILHLDFGEISAPPDGFHAGAYGELYGGAPDVANYLFYPQPATTRTTCVIAR